MAKTQDEFVSTLFTGQEGETARHKEYLEFELQCLNREDACHKAYPVLKRKRLELAMTSTQDTNMALMSKCYEKLEYCFEKAYLSYRCLDM
jgi:hypothetical protein